MVHRGVGLTWVQIPARHKTLGKPSNFLEPQFPRWKDRDEDSFFADWCEDYNPSAGSGTEQVFHKRQLSVLQIGVLTTFSPSRKYCWLEPGTGCL